jgi:hypothetical protein
MSMAMPKKARNRVTEEALERIAKIRKALNAFELACSGTLLERRKVCGKPGCRCARDPAERHGPYYEWTRRHNGKLVHRVVSPQQAQTIRTAIGNHRGILKLLRRWEAETVRVIDALSKRKR